MSLSDSFDIKEKYDEYKIEVDIETAQREFLPIDIQFNTVKTKYKIFSIVEPLKFNVVTRKLLGNSGEIIGQSPTTIEIDIVTSGTFFDSNDIKNEVCLSFKNKQYGLIYGYIKDTKISQKVGSNYVCLEFKFVGVLGTYFMDTKNEEEIKKTIRKINRRFHFD